MQRHRCKFLCVHMCSLLYVCDFGRACVCSHCVCVHYPSEAFLIKQRGDRSAECVFSHTAASTQHGDIFFPCFLSFTPVCVFIVFLLGFSSSLSLSLKPLPCLLPFSPLTPHPHFFLPSTPAKLEALRSWVQRTARTKWLQSVMALLTFG